MAEKKYHEKVTIDNAVKLRTILKSLPDFCKEFFRGIEPNTSSRTRIAYAYDLRVFFEFMYKNNSWCQKYEITNFPLSLLEQITTTDIEEYLEYLKYYKKDEIEHTNNERGLMRKLATLKSLYKYFYRKEKIQKNSADLVPMPKKYEKEIVRLDIDEVAILLDEVENGEKLTKNQKKFHDKTKIRDLALLTLLLGTGIRVSECVGLDIYDVDFKNSGIKIRRKGGYETTVYFGPEVELALLNYIEQRKEIIAMDEYKNALFLSLQKKRISVRTVENIVQKYAKLVTTIKNITPHKLRSTYGTSLYRETGDIYLVADVLGHKDVNTTKKHYAAIEDERRRKAATAVVLRNTNYE